MEHYVFISHSSKDRQIADAICHRLEESGIRCWIAPRDIDRSDWAGSIMQGLHKCDVFVVIVSQNSISSAEVVKEVTEATHACRYILPFKVDNEMLDDRMQYHLGPCHWLDAVTPPLELRIAELRERIVRLTDQDAVYVNRNQRRLISKPAMPRPFFVGREEEIDEIAEMLTQEHIVFLQGMGGIGKSEIAKGYAKTYADRYDTVLFAGYLSSIRDLIISDDIVIENLQRNTSFGEDSESPDEFFRRKFQIFRSLVTPRTLLIVDNFDVEEDPHLQDLAECPCHIIFTSRYDHSDYPTLNVGKIRDFSKVRQIFTRHYGPIPPKDIQTVDQILELVNCHTITVELIAKQMKASWLPPKKMLELLQKGGTNTNLKEKVRREGAAGSRTSFDFIRELFHLSGLNDEELLILKCMCMVPYTGISGPYFAECMELEDMAAINALLQKSWLMRHEDTGYLQMHPIICDVVRDQLKPTPEDCARYIRGLARDTRNFWFFPVEERAEKWPLVDHILRLYPRPTKALWLEFGNFTNNAWICGQFDLSIKSGHVFYDFTLQEYGADSMQAATAARWLGGCYYNAGDEGSAMPYYILAAEHHEAAPDKDLIELGITYSKVGRCAYLRHRFEEARHYLEKSLATFDAVTPENETERGDLICGIGDTYVCYQRMYMEMEDYAAALRYCQKSYDTFLTKTGSEITNCVYSLVDMGICYSCLGNYAQAERYLRRALELNISLNGQTSMVTARTREAIADNDLRQGKIGSAQKLYLALELDFEKNYGPENPQVIRLRNKRESGVL